VAATGCLLLSDAREFFSSCCSRPPRFLNIIFVCVLMRYRSQHFSPLVPTLKKHNTEEGRVYFLIYANI
jgi:hypothetical protein